MLATVRGDEAMDDERVLMALIQLDDRLGGLEGRLARLETGQNTLEGGQASMRDAQARTDARLDRIEASQTSLRVDLMARIDRLENGLTDIRNDIVVNFGAVDAVKRANDNTREEMRLMGEQMTMMFRKIQRLETRVREITGDP